MILCLLDSIESPSYVNLVEEKAYDDFKFMINYPEVNHKEYFIDSINDFFKLNAKETIKDIQEDYNYRLKELSLGNEAVEEPENYIYEYLCDYSLSLSDRYLSMCKFISIDGETYFVGNNRPIVKIKSYCNFDLKNNDKLSLGYYFNVSTDFVNTLCDLNDENVTIDSRTIINLTEVEHFNFYIDSTILEIAFEGSSMSKYNDINLEFSLDDLDSFLKIKRQNLPLKIK